MTICHACQFGEHDRHRDVIREPPPGMLGGESCRCRGECRDGRYVPPQFRNTLRAIQDHFREIGSDIPDNIILGEN